MTRGKFRKGLSVLALAGVVVLAALFSGCIGGEDGDDVETLTISGSTTVLPIAQAAAEQYMNDHKNADIQVSGGGSSTGVTNVAEGKSDIGMASRELKSEEESNYPDLVQHVVARDGIAVIAHKSNSIDSLTVAQVKGIYNGTYTNWKEVGGPNLEIVVVNRDSASGTREFFYKNVMEKEDFVSGALELNSNGAVKGKVETTDGAIGYVGLGYVDSSINAIKIDDGGNKVEPTVQNVVSGDYPIARQLNMFTDGQPKGLAKEFLDFIKGSEGQQIVEDEGFVPLS